MMLASRIKEKRNTPISAVWRRRAAGEVRCEEAGWWTGMAAPVEDLVMRSAAGQGRLLDAKFEN